MRHSVHRLRDERLARVTKPYTARGATVERCDRCRIAATHCACAARPPAPLATRSAFCLLMHDLEPLRTSNTGWLVADVVGDTHAFPWARTYADPGLLALLADAGRDPYLVFPEAAAPPERVVRAVPSTAGRRPLFVVLDATWAEARKMFRKSPYLDRFPVLALSAEGPSRYRLRRTRAEANLCTAEVAAACLRLAGEPGPAAALDAWLDAFVGAAMRVRGRP